LVVRTEENHENPGPTQKVPSGSVLTSAVTVGAVMVMLRYLICPILVPKKHALTTYYVYYVYSQKDMQLLTTWPKKVSSRCVCTQS